jgi:hypothetical protein
MSTEYDPATLADTEVNTERPYPLADNTRPALDHTFNTNPYVVYGRHFLDKLGDIKEAAGQDLDIKSDGERRTAKVWAAATGITQILDRSRIVIITAPPAAISVLEHTGSTVAAGATAAAIFTVWNGSMGETLNQGLSRFPKGVEEFSEQFPSTVELFTQSLPGIEPKNADETSQSYMLDQEHKSGAIKKLRTVVGKHIRRSFTGMGIGSTAFVATASANGYEKNEVSKVNAGVTADTAGLVFLLGLGVTESISKLGESHPALAHDIQNVVQDSRFWLGIAALSMASEYMANKKKREEIEATAITETAEI